MKRIALIRFLVNALALMLAVSPTLAFAQDAQMNAKKSKAAPKTLSAEQKNHSLARPHHFWFSPR